MARVVLGIGFAVTRAVAFPGSLVVTILYWGVVYPYGAADLQPLSFFTHGFNVVAMVTDSLISKARLPLLMVFTSSRIVFFTSFGPSCSSTLSLNDLARVQAILLAALTKATLPRVISAGTYIAALTGRLGEAVP